MRVVGVLQGRLKSNLPIVVPHIGSFSKRNMGFV